MANPDLGTSDSKGHRADAQPRDTRQSTREGRRRPTSHSGRVRSFARSCASVAGLEGLGSFRADITMVRNHAWRNLCSASRDKGWVMVRELTRSFVRSWFFTWLAFVLMASWWGSQTLPTARYWFEARAMVVPDVSIDEPIVLLVDREIKRPVRGDWHVTIRRYNGNDGWLVYCNANGSANYSPTAELPEPLTLDWWTDGQCSISNPGEYIVSTTWEFFPPWAAGERRTPPLISNAFTVGPPHNLGPQETDE